jgi:hypothetical protein
MMEALVASSRRSLTPQRAPRTASGGYSGGLTAPSRGAIQRGAHGRTHARSRPQQDRARRTRWGNAAERHRRDPEGLTLRARLQTPRRTAAAQHRRRGARFPCPSYCPRPEVGGHGWAAAPGQVSSPPGDLADVPSLGDGAGVRESSGNIAGAERLGRLAGLAGQGCRELTEPVAASEPTRQMQFANCWGQEDAPAV